MYREGDYRVGAEGAAGLRGFCFQRRRSPECLKVKRVFPAKSDCRDSPEGSSNATTRDEMDPALYVEGALTQDGGCVRPRVWNVLERDKYVRALSIAVTTLQHKLW